MTSVSVSLVNRHPRSKRLCSQNLEVFDDAVVNDGHTLGRVGVGILSDRWTVRRPPRMTDADAPTQRLLVQQTLQLAKLACRPTTENVTIHQGGDTRRIIAPIL